MPEKTARTSVLKTYKLFVGGRFPRSESGRVYQVRDHRTSGWLANAPAATRKDARDAVVAARKAQPGWAAATAYNRGQVLYRIAEMIETRAPQFAAEVAAAEGLKDAAATALVAATVDRWAHYAGWTDKIAQVAGNANPVAGPYLDWSAPEPTGVVVLLAPAAGHGFSLLGVSTVLAATIAGGNAAVLVAPEGAPLPALSLAEALATSDVPGGVVNILSGRLTDLAPSLAGHRDVNAIDLAGAAGEPADSPAAPATLEATAVGNLKRVLRPGAVAADRDLTAPPGLRRLLAFQETKTIWHPVGT